MGNIILNTLFVILLVLTLVLFTIYYLIDSVETEEKIVSSNEITGAMKTYEVSHYKGKFLHPTKKYTKRYDEKLIDYLEHKRKSKDNTFHKGKVFLKER